MRSSFRIVIGVLFLFLMLVSKDFLFSLDCSEVFSDSLLDNQESTFKIEVFHGRNSMSKAMFNTAFLNLKPLFQETRDLLVAVEETGSFLVSLGEPEELKLEEVGGKNTARILLLDLIYNHLQQAKKHYHYHSITVPYWYQTHHPELRTIRLMVKILSSDQFIQFFKLKDQKHIRDPFTELEDLSGVDDMLYEMSLIFSRDRASELNKIQVKYGFSQVELLDMIEGLFKSLILSLGKRLYATDSYLHEKGTDSSFKVENPKVLGSAQIVSSNTIKIETKLLRSLRKEGRSEFAGEIYIKKNQGDKKILVPALNSYDFSYFTLRGKSPFTLVRFPHGTFNNSSPYIDTSDIFTNEREIKALIKMIKKDGMLIINGINDIPSKSLLDE